MEAAAAKAKAPIPPWRKRKYKPPKAKDGLDTRPPQLGLNISDTLRKGEEILKMSQKLQKDIEVSTAKARVPWRKAARSSLRAKAGGYFYAPTGKAPAIAASTLRIKAGFAGPPKAAAKWFGPPIKPLAPGSMVKAPPPAKGPAPMKGPPKAKEWSWRSVPAKAVVNAVKRLGAKASPKQKAMAQAASIWLQRKGRSMEKKAELATAYFKQEVPEEGNPNAKAKVIRFAPAFLEQLPSNIQSCQSFGLFVKKKLADAVPDGPTLDAPADVRDQVHDFADALGRSEGIMSAGEWDTRAKRIFDLGKFVETEDGKKAIKDALATLEAGREPLATRLSQGWDKTLDQLIPERKEWAKKYTQRAWYSWLEKLLKAREESLIAGVEKAQPGPVGAAELAQCLILGKPL
mmetsp:Transcript_2992/g.7649  ORF Transcript_2992/g.7649 Transcript_2992/m.7649 type:complete len:403 (-) Transcript_2992:10-1218(-)